MSKPDITTKDLADALLQTIRELEGVKLASGSFKDVVPAIQSYQNYLQRLANIHSVLVSNQFEVKGDQPA